jgi:hypothetical protein
MGLLHQNRRRRSVQQLQLNLADDEKVDLDRKVEQQLIEQMAEMMIAVMLRGKETSDGHRTS